MAVVAGETSVVGVIIQVPQPAAHLQTVEESNEHRGPYTYDPSEPALQEKPSQRCLARPAPDPTKSYAPEEAVYAQEGDGLKPNDTFQETVAELLEEQEYGVFRLVVPCIRLPRAAFNDYVEWLKCQPVVAKGQAGGPPVRAHSARSIFGLPLIQPFAPFALGWTCLMMIVDLTWTAFGVPINVAFCSVDYGNLHSSCTATDLTFGTIYFLNLLLSFQLGVMVVNGHRKKTCMDGRHVAMYYMRYGRFILDVAATIPLFYLIAILSLSDGQGYQTKWVNVLALLRLLRLLRVLPLVSMSEVIYLQGSFSGNARLSKYLDVTRIHIIIVTYQTLIMVNFLACVLILIAYLYDPLNSWMTAVTWVDLPYEPKPYQWFCAIYWILTTTTTTGFGDFAPRWWGEQVVIAAAMVIGLVIFGILVGNITHVIARANDSALRLQAHRHKISQINQWLKRTDKLDPNSKLRIQEYFAQVFVAKQSVEYGEAELFTDLPPYLRFEAASELSLPLIQSVHALRSLNLDAQQLLAAHMRPVRAIVGQELCRQGDEADRLWLLASGSIVALRHKEPPQHITAPALVGESLILALDVPQCRHRPWTLRTASPCSLWELRLHDLSRIVSIYPAISLSLLEHVREELFEHIFDLGARGPQPEVHPRAPVYATEDWCELVALLQGALDCLQGEPSVRFEELCMQLERANIGDDSLKAILSELVDGAMVRDALPREAVMGYPLGLQKQIRAQQAAERAASVRPHAPPLDPTPSAALHQAFLDTSGRTASHNPDDASLNTAGSRTRSGRPAPGVASAWHWLSLLTRRGSARSSPPGHSTEEPGIPQGGTPAGTTADAARGGVKAQQGTEPMGPPGAAMLDPGGPNKNAPPPTGVDLQQRPPRGRAGAAGEQLGPAFAPNPGPGPFGLAPGPLGAAAAGQSHAGGVPPAAAHRAPLPPPARSMQRMGSSQLRHGGTSTGPAPGSASDDGGGGSTGPGAGASVRGPHGPSRLAPRPPALALQEAVDSPASDPHSLGSVAGGGGRAAPASASATPTGAAVPAPALPALHPLPGAATAFANLRSNLVRMSPFATAFAPGNPAVPLSPFGPPAVAPTPSPGGVAPPQPAGPGPGGGEASPGTGGGTGGGAGPGAAPVPTAPCAHCGCSGCPVCGSWVPPPSCTFPWPPPGTAPAPTHTGAQAPGPPPGGLGPSGPGSGSGPGVGPGLTRAASLLDAFRGLVPQRSTVGLPGPGLSRYGTMPSNEEAQGQQSGAGSGGGGGPTPGAFASTSLVRRSRMYGRAYPMVEHAEALAYSLSMRQRDPLMQEFVAEAEEER
ncbi:hypothetical protein HYH03_005478 [Edaphochlamys debaryana]|uniref:Cyclic nucleotide-binding domain-containing protein n=1 Tax=Edaphochlamys debaryana TaxID=47281 RepID=A0A835Y8D7_9CHLO|nr:hypothetical protein HYH03_005478 [Edaphochlamys debaryana]|eukprot:KAG2496658.1 hypothetical protein HYH03_005478 [Edaphochlamys debaryana]